MWTINVKSIGKAIAFAALVAGASAVGSAIGVALYVVVAGA